MFPSTHGVLLSPVEPCCFDSHPFILAGLLICLIIKTHEAMAVPACVPCVLKASRWRARYSLSIAPCSMLGGPDVDAPQPA